MSVNENCECNKCNCNDELKNRVIFYLRALFGALDLVDRGYLSKAGELDEIQLIERRLWDLIQRIEDADA